MMELALPVLLIGLVYLVTRKPSEPVPPAQKPPYTPGSGHGWYLIPPFVAMLPKDAFTSTPKIGDFASYWLGDGARAKAGEIITEANSDVIIAVIAKIDGGKEGTGDTGDFYPGTIVTAVFARGTLEQSPTQLPTLGTKVRVTRSFAIIAPAAAVPSP